MFLNTFSISEKTVRTALKKKMPSGTVETEKRGGRQDHLQEEDKQRRDKIKAHIDRFPRMESHYCRSKSTRDYLHSDLNQKKMYEMFLAECCVPEGLSASYTTYCDVLKPQNISFHNPKKDQCKICENFRKGDSEKKKELMCMYEQHNKEKYAVRKIKEQAKNNTKSNVQVAVFDLQQVIYLPKTNDNQLSYKRRLSNYNFTIYELKSKNCHCYTWHEGQGKRGSSEIATCVRTYLENLNTAGIHEVILFADGCPGQNKNSIIATMLLHSVQNLGNIKRIKLLYFEAYHGQSEGDSAHSAISTAIERVCDLLVPSQLIPVFRLARRKNPYSVHTLQHSDFQDYKTLANHLRIRSVREDDQGHDVVWLDMREVMVQKTDRDKLFFKTSHQQESYRSITLKRKWLSALDCNMPSKLYSKPPKISKEKYDDLMSLCKAPLPMVRVAEYVSFFESLPHSS
ncbi:hypothetical protein Pcinc_013882 [Petrolisthes cinctipes]|uniref:Uncharacterized protein n=1 Tax=Petrolisthes cinctipes TaxID=88211 RepID=A0AAE1FXZ9_PETCI|nr:hypothetical protein Pcinc_013882 [Petrolisthes cinctipes]